MSLVAFVALAAMATACGPGPAVREDVAFASLKERIERWRDRTWWPFDGFFVAVDGEDPSPRLVQRLDAITTHPVLPASQHRQDPEGRPTAPGGWTGVLLDIVSMQFESCDRVVVVETDYAGAVNYEWWKTRHTLRDGRWQDRDFISWYGRSGEYARLGVQGASIGLLVTDERWEDVLSSLRESDP